MIKLYLFDIEGTTTDIKFVHNILFPYSKERIKDYILHNQTHPEVMKAIQQVHETVWEEEKKKIGLYDVIEKLITWINLDRKHGALKTIQGLIWNQGYAQKDFMGHVYTDVKPFFESIIKNGNKIGIYSSGSVHAQKLIFGFSEAGDLTPMISYYFDTKVGGKREKSSYQRISEEVELKPQDIQFFSDIPEELKAAEEAGMIVTQVLRPGTEPSNFKGIQSFLSV